ncbi:MAG: SDR family oxidoreductase [Proteobacteria bacterium]|nr:MAG: SDR family oxidoreductase [Pseudomonadota bacterium]
MKKLVVITGASSGIGRATAIRFASLGHPLLLLARRIDKLAELNLPNTLCRKVDVTDLDSFQAAVNEAESQFGEVDLIVNNAGIMLLGNAITQNPQEWQQMLNVNVMGVLNGVKTVLGKMVARQGGTIINISSIAGRKTFPDHAAYCATKFAVHALTENIRGEVAGSNVRMTVIAPGVVETELLSHTTDNNIVDGYKQWKASTIEQGLNPDDIARTIEFAYSQPQNVCIREIVIADTRQDA